VSARGFGLYIHWPYCARICPYCDFNVYRARGRDTSFLLDAIEADIVAHAALAPKRPLDTVFFGGGTPGLLSGGEIARLIAAAERAFGFVADVEISIECNPEDASRFAEHAAAGVTRFSIGMQALDDAALRALGRAHDAAIAIAAVEAAARTGARVSLDLIYAREGQSVEAWQAELARALSLPAEHVSLYQLTIEAGTAFARAAERGRLRTPGEALAADLYEATQALCEAAGMCGYEISNHARGDDAQSRHNLIYWRGGAWVGVGPGAHGRVEFDGARHATEAHARPEDYAAAVAEKGVGWAHSGPLSPSETADEALLMGVRLVEGVDRAHIEALRGRPLDPHALTTLAAEALIVVDAARLRLTPAGRLVADRVAAMLCG
jgi:oxygen-independent coproporphyrinogen-3 oxidase